MVEEKPDQPGRDDVTPEDSRLLADLSAALGTDPLPAGIIERATALIALQDLEHDLAALLDDAGSTVGVRSATTGPTTLVGPPGAHPLTRLSFESSDGEVAADVEVVPGALRGQVHADAPVTVELVRTDGTLTPVPVDHLGGFLLRDPAPGPARLRVRPDGAPTVVTDWFVI